MGMTRATSISKIWSTCALPLRGVLILRQPPNVLQFNFGHNFHLSAKGSPDFSVTQSFLCVAATSSLLHALPTDGNRPTLPLDDTPFSLAPYTMHAWTQYSPVFLPVRVLHSPPLDRRPAGSHHMHSPVSNMRAQHACNNSTAHNT